MYEYIHIYMYLYIHVCMYAQVNEYMYTCNYVYMYVYTLYKFSDDWEENAQDNGSWLALLDSMAWTRAR